MSKKISHWIASTRPHTLVLAISCVGMGNIIAAINAKINVIILILSIITALMLQILSNLANDYGDFKHGTDNNERVGPKRALQKGLITEKEMKKAVGLTAFLSLFFGFVLLAFSFKNIGVAGLLVLLVSGFLAIWAAYAYTASEKPYGYKGFGDIFVFIFFGLFSVAGTFFLQTGTLNLWLFLPASAIGLLGVGVLNLNNLRDIDSDKKTGKVTIAVKLGKKKAAYYQLIIVILSFMLLFVFHVFYLKTVLSLLALLPFLLFFLSLKKVFSFKEPFELYHVLKKFSLYILLLVVSHLFIFLIL